VGPANQLYLADDGHRIVLRPEGRCTAILADAIHRYLEQSEIGAGHDVYFDLSGASFVESTFAGLLVKLARRHASPATDRPVHLLAPSPPAMTALNQMGLARFFDICDALPQQPPAWAALPVEGSDPQALADLIVEAHESLIAANPDNQAAFDGVIRCFKAAKDKGG